MFEGPIPPEVFFYNSTSLQILINIFLHTGLFTIVLNGFRSILFGNINPGFGFRLRLVNNISWNFEIFATLNKVTNHFTMRTIFRLRLVTLPLGNKGYFNFFSKVFVEVCFKTLSDEEEENIFWDCINYISIGNQSRWRSHDNVSYWTTWPVGVLVLFFRYMYSTSRFWLVDSFINGLCFGLVIYMLGFNS